MMPLGLGIIKKIKGDKAGIIRQYPTGSKLIPGITVAIPFWHS